MIIVKEQKEVGGYDSQGNRYIWAHLECDSAADLPAPDYFKADAAAILAMGSTAHTIAENAGYELNSGGVWMLQEPGTAAYTKAETDALLSEKQDLLVLGENFDAEPTSGSVNPVRSGGVVNYTFGAAAAIIPSGANLNSYIDPGAYRCESNAIAATLVNCPTANGFRMEVKSTIASAATGYQLQFIYPNNANGEFFMRRRGSASSGTWSSWFKFQGTAV